MTGARDAPKLVRAPRDEVSEEASEVFPAEVSQLDVIATWSIMRMRPTRQLVKFWRALVTPKRVRTSGKGEIKCNNTFAQRRGTVYLIEQRHSRSEPRSVLDEGFQPRGKIGVQLLALDEARDVPRKNVRLAAGNGGGAGCSSDSRLDR